jgi:hypothetical protein
MNCSRSWDPFPLFGALAAAADAAFAALTRALSATAAAWAVCVA